MLTISRRYAADAALFHAYAAAFLPLDCRFRRRRRLRC